MKCRKFLLLILLLFLFGCTDNDGTNNNVGSTQNTEILPATEKKADVIKYIRTTDKKMALTFNGLADQETMQQILIELDKVKIKATFFIQGIRVAEEPELVQEIIDRGHSVQNNTLNHKMLDDLSYEQTFLEIELSNQIFKEQLNYTPTFVRSRSGDSSENMEYAAAQLNMDIAGYYIYPKDREMQSAEEIAEYVKKHSTRGAIIQLNTYINPSIISAISLIQKNALEEGYELTTLENVLASSTDIKAADDILKSNSLSMNLDYSNVKPNLIYKKRTTKKEVALTFDDWASDSTISEVLEILDHYQIKSTFFLIGKGVEKNPNLAKLILESGHEVANHSFNHLDVTKMDPKELQEDIIKADKAITEALQQAPLRYFRPSRGEIDEESAKVISATGVDVIAMYDVASFDWHPELSANDIHQRVKQRIRPGSVIVMHILDDIKTTEALPLIIEDLLQQGYEFKKMSEWISEAE